MKDVMAYLAEVPFDVSRKSLYHPAELYEGFDPIDESSYSKCFDSIIYQRYMSLGQHTNNVNELLARTLHDHSIHTALARFFKQRGDNVSGYDRTPSPLTAELEAEGIGVHYEDNPDLIPEGVDLVIYTPAVPQELHEFVTLKERGVKMEKRSQVLGELTRGKKCIAVAGSHGKTTTSTLIAHLLSSSGCGCSAFLGGIGKNFGSNLHMDNKSEYVVVEADEYDRSFLQLHPHYAVITATDPDHLDIYGTHEAMLEAYAQFANQTDIDGKLFLKQGIFMTSDGEPFGHHHDDHGEHDEHSHEGFDFIKRPYATYTAHGVDADYYAINVRA